SGLSRWRAGQWSTIASNVIGSTTALHASDDGELHVGGVFTTIGSAGVSYVARFDTPCPAQVAAAGGGCTWSSGFSLLEAEAPAWLGGTYCARGTGLPPNALAASVYGFSQVTAPLWQFLPMTGPGCFSHTSGDFVELAVPVAGALRTDEPLPNSAALNGVAFYHQLVVFELDAQGACIGVTSSNALELTLGTF
ncbi:MAG: hypothetical protein KAI24_21670, partial [Planctomycetes bacterium]|nr:hypothetical protein [Planctomycetota bacterium]